MSEKELFFKSVTMIRYIVSALKHTLPEFKSGELKHNWQHPKNTSEILIEGIDVGSLCTIHPQNSSKIDKNAAVVCFEIDMDELAKVEKTNITFDEPSKFPSSEFDLSVVVPDGKTYGEMEEAWKVVNCEAVKEVNVIDVYETENEKSITVRFVFSLADRTITGEEVQACMDQIIRNLEKSEFSIKS